MLAEAGPARRTRQNNATGSTVLLDQFKLAPGCCVQHGLVHCIIGLPKNTLDPLPLRVFDRVDRRAPREEDRGAKSAQPRPHFLFSSFSSTIFNCAVSGGSSSAASIRWKCCVILRLEVWTSSASRCACRM